MFCGKCGKQLPDGSRFCGYCGASLEQFTAMSDKADEIKEEVAPVIEEKIEEIEEEVTPVIEERVEEFNEEIAPVIEERVEEFNEEITPAIEEKVEEIGEEVTPVIEEKIEEIEEEVTPVIEEIPEVEEESILTVAEVFEEKTEEIIKEAPVIEEIEEEIAEPVQKPAVEIKAAEPMIEKQTAPKKEKPVYKFNFGRFILSLFLAILLLAFVFSAAVVSVARFNLTEDKCAELIDDTELEKIVLPIDDEGEEVELSDYVYDICCEYDIEDDVSRSDIENLLEEDFIKDFIEDNIEEYRAYLFDGEETDGITSDRIVKFLKKNEKKIRKSLDLTDEEFIFDYDELEDELDDYIGDDFSIETIEEEYETEAKAVQLGLSVISQILLIFLAVVFAVLIFIVNKKRVRNAFVYTGVPLTIVGALFLLIGIVMTVFMLVDISGIPAFVATLSSFMFASFLIIGGGLLLISIIFYIINAVMKKSEKKKANA